MEAHKHTCLNCDTVLAGAYCHGCGQKADTHRITLPHLIKHDLVHGVWHFDKGLLYTLRESFLRPGYMAMDYIKGKRVKYYNVFYLILMVLGINLLATHYFKLYYNISEKAETTGLVMHKDTVDVSHFVKHNLKLLFFFVIPFFAFSGFVSFRRLKLNFAEHAIIAGNLLLTAAMWYFLLNVGMYTSITFESDAYNYFVWALAVVVYLQPARIYYQATRKAYTTGAFILHMLLWYICLGLLFYGVLLLITVFTGKANITLT